MYGESSRADNCVRKDTGGERAGGTRAGTVFAFLVWKESCHKRADSVKVWRSRRGERRIRWTVWVGCVMDVV